MCLTQEVSKITVVGAAGGIGQPLSAMLKLNVAPDVLALYDVSPAAPGVAADVSHVPTKGQVIGDFDAALPHLTLQPPALVFYD